MLLWGPTMRVGAWEVRQDVHEEDNDLQGWKMRVPEISTLRL